MVGLVWLVGFILFVIIENLFLVKEQGRVSLNEFMIIVVMGIVWPLSALLVGGYWLEENGDKITVFGKKK